MLGNAYLFDDMLRGEFNAKTEEVLIAISGYSVSRSAFGEGNFTWTLTNKQFQKSSLSKARVLFQPGT